MLGLILTTTPSRKVIRPVARLQIAVTVWPTNWYYILWSFLPCNFFYCILSLYKETRNHLWETI